MTYSNYPEVEERVALKLALLRRWMKEGVPEGVYCPKSLATARVWDDPEMGAFGVGSKREWNSTNSPHRASIVAMAEVLKVLKKATALKEKTKRYSYAERIEELTTKSQAIELAREAATDQWQDTSQRLQSATLDLNISKARIAHLEKKLESADETIARLKREFYKVHPN